MISSEIEFGEEKEIVKTVNNLDIVPCQIQHSQLHQFFQILCIGGERGTGGGVRRTNLPPPLPPHSLFEERRVCV